MEEEDTKLCSNCKRDIPAVNFTTHSVHCARNIRPCPVCKEPVPAAQLQEHHDALHKEVPCKKCGESVCGTDLEDHIRDSCAQTIKPCRYCELELPRHSLPAHETYCGARSEQCPDCREYVMAKYRQLHLDSNHGFIRLDDDPTPQEVKPKLKPISNGFPAASSSRNGALPKPAVKKNDTPGSSRSDGRSDRAEGVGNRVERVSSGVKGAGSGVKGVGSRVEGGSSGVHGGSSRPDGARNGTKVTLKRTNDQPQINTNVQPAEKVVKDLPSRGAVRKRPAPPPPADPKRDLAFWSAAKRQQAEERKRAEQNAYNLSVGLPPVLSPAAKLEKLRKMDALHNREVEDKDYKNRLQGRVWQPQDVPTGYVLGGSPESTEARPRSPGEVGRRLWPWDDAASLAEFRNLQPMTTEEFMNRFQELQLGADRRRNPAERNGVLPGAAETAGATEGARQTGRAAAGGDRFSEIKSSLQELRRGLNEVTAPYNSAPAASNNAAIDSNRLWPPAGAGAADDDELRLPCEFCGTPIPAEDLVLHQTGCRPDLAQYQPGRAPRTRRPPRAARAPSPAPADSDEPVIPCEFCTESLPVYLISEHQERCRSEANNILFPD